MGNWFAKEQKRIIIQGLDAAGKTSLLYRLKLGEVVTTIPTIGFNVETIDIKGINICCWDVGGRDKIRPLYRHYYHNTQGFVYVIDSNDRERLDDALDELVKYVLLEDETRDTVIMILANKQDLPDALSPEEIQEALLKKYKFSPASPHTVFILPCSVVNGEGIFDAFNFFVDQLRLKKAGKAQAGLLPHAKYMVRPEAKPETEAEKMNTISIKQFMKSPLDYMKSIFYR